MQKDVCKYVPEALTALKYFREDAPEYNVLAAGSLLGIALHSDISFPVGNVEFMDLFPLTFKEFLDAVGEKPLVEVLDTADWKLITAFKSKFTERLRQYYFVGGMPEAVLRFSSGNNFAEVRYVQEQILDAYEQDFSKHAPPVIVPRIRMLWNSIPSQLAKENKKFIYGKIKSGSRAKDYEIALSWMTDCGQVHKVFRVTKPGIPLKAYEDGAAFKLFIVDIGLLSAMVNIDAKTLLDRSLIFTEFKGALAEQYVFQQLNSINNLPVWYWSADRSTAEVDFLIQHEGKFVPLEVKAEENLQAKSLKVFAEKFNPALSFRVSMSDYRNDKWLINLPLYAVNLLTEEISHNR